MPFEALLLRFFHKLNQIQTNEILLLFIGFGAEIDQFELENELTQLERWPSEILTIIFEPKRAVHASAFLSLFFIFLFI